MIDISLPIELSKAEKYQLLLKQLNSLFTGETDLIANMANLSAVLQSNFDFLWTGFYLNRKEQLVLGPFQGPLACTRISIGKGVCGTAAKNAEAVVVADVNDFPGHIVCSPHSKSEIVIPGILNNSTIFVLDIDSDKLSHFDSTDKIMLEQIVQLLIDASDCSFLQH